MTLEQFLNALTNTSVVVTVKENENELIKLYAPGYQQLVEPLLARIVEKITIINQTAVTVILESEVSA